MLTIIKAMGQVTGSGIILFGSIFCIALFVLLFIAFDSNRNKKAITIYLTILLLVFEFCDVIWLLYFFPKGNYINRGLAPIGIFLIFPLLCIILNFSLTVFNKTRISRNRNL